MKYLILVFITAFIISGCQQIPPTPGGVSDFQMNPDGSFKVKNTKEYADVEAWVMSPDGTKQYYYHAKGVEAFSGQAITAQLQTTLEKQQLELFRELPGILSNAFGEALKSYAGGAAPMPDVTGATGTLK